MKHGLILYGRLDKAFDWNLLVRRVGHWKSEELSNGDSFFTTVSMSFGENMLDSKFIEDIDSRIEGTFDICLSASSDSKFLIRDIQQCINKGLASCEKAGLMYTAVCDYNYFVNNIDKVFDNKKLSCLSTSKNPAKDKLLSPAFMFGKTKTLKTIWKNLPCANTHDVERATFRSFANVAGQNLELMNTLQPDSIGIMGRVSFQ